MLKIKKWDKYIFRVRNREDCELIINACTYINVNCSNCKNNFDMSSVRESSGNCGKRDRVLKPVFLSHLSGAQLGAKPILRDPALQ